MHSTTSIEVIEATPAQLTDLNGDERKELKQCESVIEGGKKTFLAVGNALSQIRDGRLYRETHKTFQDYCQKKWNFDKSYANRLISAAAVVATIVANSDDDYQVIPPANEAQANALADVSEDERAEAWQEAVETAPAGKVTAAHVRKTSARRRKTTARRRKVEAKPDHRLPWTKAIDAHLERAYKHLRLCLDEIILPDLKTINKENLNLPVRRQLERLLELAGNSNSNSFGLYDCAVTIDIILRFFYRVDADDEAAS